MIIEISPLQLCLAEPSSSRLELMLAIETLVACAIRENPETPNNCNEVVLLFLFEVSATGASPVYSNLN
jgi:hypothetical protein